MMHLHAWHRTGFLSAVSTRLDESIKQSIFFSERWQSTSPANILPDGYYFVKADKTDWILQFLFRFFWFFRTALISDWNNNPQKLVLVT
jgi:hypothetical protein